MSPPQTNQPSLSVPDGGGAIRSIGETFTADSFTGTATFAVPIPTSPGRNEFGPELGLRYASGAGNGPFGLGWQLGVPAVTRRTEKGLPTYGPDDVFVLSGAEELVPVDDAPIVKGPFSCQRYRPRIEGLFARIEHWVEPGGVGHWRVTSGAGVTNVYGRTAGARIADPDDGSRVFEWRLEETFDARGNHVLYTYAAEDPAAVPGEMIEHGRRHAQRYLRRIFYNPTGLDVGPRRAGIDPSDPTGSADRRYLFEVLFDYGDAPAPAVEATTGPEMTTATWPNRPDRFSSYRPGFEVRTLRRCQRILMVHHLPELGDGGTVVKSVDLGYESTAASSLSLLSSVQVTGHRGAGDQATTASNPPITFGYAPFDPQNRRLRPLTNPDGEMPATGLIDPDVTLVDVTGSGRPDLLDTRGDRFRLWRNRGDGRFDGPRPIDGPGGVSLSQPGVRLASVEGDGRTDLVLIDGPVNGYFERSEDDRGWTSFQPFARSPGVDPSNPGLHLVDLTGNGLTDLVMGGGERLVWFPGLGSSGFGEPVVVPQSIDPARAPAVDLADPVERVRLADMTGDGLDDIVVVVDGRIDYWPNLGYGRFGPRITMVDSPRLGHDHTLDRVFLTDLDGSGCADLVQVEGDRVHLWFNRSGNGWSEQHTIRGTPPVDAGVDVRPADVFGSGTTCLLWSRHRHINGSPNHLALDICGGVKPHLLTRIDNGVGTSTRIEYAPSTDYATEAEDRDESWVTKLPFPVHVVSRVEVTDRATGVSLTTTYQYHNGAFDGREREFRGFARVDRLESGGASGDPLATDPPVLTRTWFETGLDNDRLADRREREIYGLDPDALGVGPNDLRLADGSREARRALRGAPLREEVYGVDGSDAEPHPFLVTETSYQVRALQPRGADGRAVHITTPATRLVHHYERQPNDPRITQRLTLPATPNGALTDDDGNVTDSAVIAYPRRPGPPPQRLAEQTDLQVRLVHTDHARLVDDDTNLTGFVSRERSYEVQNLAWDQQDGRPVATADLAAVAADPDDRLLPGQAPVTGTQGPTKRLLAETRSLFRRDDAAAQVDDAAGLALGTIESLALPFEQYQASMTDPMAADWFGTDPTGDRRVDGARLTGAGYVAEDELWWIPAGRQRFSPTEHYLPVGFRDPFGGESTLAWDRYGLMLTATVDAAGNEIRAEAIDYRVLAPTLVRDPNYHRTEIVYDTLGLPVATAARSRDGDGENLTGLDPDVPLATIRTMLDAGSGTDLREGLRRLLGGASSRTIRDLHRMDDLGQPPVVLTITRGIHASELGPNDAAPDLYLDVVHSDGWGRPIQRKVRGTDDPADGTPRLIVSGTTVHDRRGRPAQLFEPWFSGTIAFEPTTRHGVATRLFRDAVGREVAQLRPDGSYTKVIVGPWTTTAWDANDSVLLDPRNDPDVATQIGPYIDALEATGVPFQTWHQRRSGSSSPGERAAAAGADAHAATPTTLHLDPLGRPCRTEELDRDETGALRAMVTRRTLDLDGNEIEVVDPNGMVAESHLIDLAGRILVTDNIDAGRRSFLPDIDDEPSVTWDAVGHRVEIRRDGLRRTTHVEVTDPQGNSSLRERTVYGEAHPDSIDPGTGVLSLRGHPWLRLDGAGAEIETDVAGTRSHGFTGVLEARHRRLTPIGVETPDWSSVEPLLAATVVDLDAITTALDQLLDSETFETTWSHDAQDRVTEMATPDGSVTEYSYDIAGELTSIDVRPVGATAATNHLERIDRDAHGRRISIAYGNGVRSELTYHAEDLRLRSLRSRHRDGTEIQSISYTHDAAGNLVDEIDVAQPTIFTSNQMVDSRRTFRYDALYRLVEAQGREHRALGQTAPRQYDPTGDGRTGLAHPADGNQVQRYTRRYRYDPNGNLLEMSHRAGGAGFNRQADLVSGTNRLRSTSFPGEGSRPTDSLPTRYLHDENGNMIEMPHLPRIRWDHNDRMLGADLPGGGTVSCHHSASGHRVRQVVVKSNLIEERVYLGSTEIFRRHDSNTGTIQDETTTLHVSDDDARVAIVERTSRRAGVTIAAPVPVTRHQLGDRLGSAAVELDEQGRVIGYEEYYPFGATSIQTVTTGPDLGRKRYRFSGKERDEHTGLDDFGARRYAAWLGRWISPDPAGSADGLNRYAFTRLNPMRLVDPDGRGSDDPPLDPPPTAMVPADDPKLPSRPQSGGKPGTMSKVRPGGRLSRLGKFIRAVGAVFGFGIGGETIEEPPDPAPVGQRADQVPEEKGGRGKPAAGGDGKGGGKGGKGKGGGGRGGTPRGGGGGGDPFPGRGHGPGSGRPPFKGPKKPFRLPPGTRFFKIIGVLGEVAGAVAVPLEGYELAVQYGEAIDPEHRKLARFDLQHRQGARPVEGTSFWVNPDEKSLHVIAPVDLFDGAFEYGKAAEVAGGLESVGMQERYLVHPGLELEIFQDSDGVWRAVDISNGQRRLVTAR